MSSHNPFNVFSSQAFLLDPRRELSCGVSPDSEARPRTMLLGLPCARCRAYYSAELEACPICGCRARVSAGGTYSPEMQSQNPAARKVC
jgi:hypothetical protein